GLAAPAGRLADPARDRALRRPGVARHDHYPHERAPSLLCPARPPGAKIRRRRRPSRLHLVGRDPYRQQARMAGLDPAAANVEAPPRPTASYGGRHRQSARRAGDVSRRHAVSHPRLERARHDRPGGFVRLHPHDQRRRRRPLQPCKGGLPGRRHPLKITAPAVRFGPGAFLSGNCASMFAAMNAYSPVAAPPLIDPFGRTIAYVRASVTDRCDYRCVYCMSEDMNFLPKRDVLTLEELDRLCSAFVALGARKLRITGGEPLVRRDIMRLFRSLSRHLASGALDELTLTTNGSQLERFASELVDCGVRRVNVSLDTLDAGKFRAITRWGDLGKVMAGVDRAQAAGLSV